MCKQTVLKVLHDAYRPVLDLQRTEPEALGSCAKNMFDVRLLYHASQALYTRVCCRLQLSARQPEIPALCVCQLLPNAVLDDI